MSYTGDTHARVRFLEGSPRSGTEARSAFRNVVWLVVALTIVLAGITFPHARYRIAIDLPHMVAPIGSPTNCLVYALVGAVLERLPTNLNIHDAIIVATARG
jgi:hypothetical protein